MASLVSSNLVTFTGLEEFNTYGAVLIADFGNKFRTLTNSQANTNFTTLSAGNIIIESPHAVP